MLGTLIDRFLHLDHDLAALAAEHRTFVYLLLFAAGALAAKGMFSLTRLAPSLVGAAALDDAVKDAIGDRLRRRIALSLLPGIIGWVRAPQGIKVQDRP